MSGVESSLKAYVRSAREKVNSSLAGVENSSRPATEGFVSRVAPVVNQLRYAASRIPHVREKYPAAIVGGVTMGFSIPALLTRGRFAGVMAGVVAGSTAALGLSVSDWLDKHE